MARLDIRIACCALVLAATARGEGFAGNSTSLALRAANPDMLSGGLFDALDAAGVYGRPTLRRAIRAGIPDLAKGQPPAVLDARVGANVRVGDDPAILPETQLGQAEPHLYRSAAQPNLLLATFQEGRFSDAGAFDCGYGISFDAGLSWSRALIPSLTTASGGRFNRATDPVAAIGPEGNLYLNTLGSTSGAFASAAIVVSRSSDNGATWSMPNVVFESTDTRTSPDKNWMAVNDYAGTTNAGRLVVTWTNFTSNSSGATTGNNLLCATSDDHGTTWSAPAAITPEGSFNQGTQPVWLPDGSLVVVYVTFASVNATVPFTIECKRSPDGGRTFPATSTIIVPAVAGWDDPDLRDGVFLPSATVARQSGDIFVTYTAVVSGTPRVLVTKSSDRGSTWSAPAVASDNPAGASVANPAVAASPDGKTVTTIFIDKRNASDGHNFIDTYAALSFDGGTTWNSQPNVRLTDHTSDIRYGPLTTRGYMFGDYQALVPALNSGDACVGIWCDARTGDSDPFTVRFTPATVPTYDTWRIANGVGAGSEDPDGDGVPNALEYALATNPRRAESGETLVVSRDASGNLNAAIAGRTELDGQLTFATTVTTGGAQVAPLPPGPHEGTAPDVPLRAGMSWRTFLYPNAPIVTTIQPMITGYTDSTAGSGVHRVTGGETVTPGTTSRLNNVSSRGTVGTGTSDMIVGFVIDGPKTMLVRAAGPALAAFSVTNYLANPQLTLSSTSGNTQTIATNAAWTQSTASAAVFQSLGAFPFTSGSSDAAVLETLPAGAYTGVVSGANGTTGTALVEAYDASGTPGAGTRIVDLSTRANVATGGDGTLIAGFVIGGTQPRRVLIRAVGPSLASFNLNGTLYDPVLTLYRQGSNLPLTSNDDWQLSHSDAAVAATAKRLGAFALNPGSLDASLLITLPPGNYTATVTSLNNTTGIALVEVYDAD